MLGVLPVGPPGVVGQSASITLSFDDGAGTPSAVTGVSEGGGGQSVRVVATASAATSANVDVTVSIAAGTATATTDYGISATSATVQIASGQMVGYSSALTVTPVDDSSVEGDETIVFSATTTATGYSAISDVGLNIVDDDFYSITLSFDDGAGTPSAVTGVAEEGGAQMVRVVATASAATSAAVTVNVSAAAGTATLTTDYEITAPAASWTVTIASGDTVGRAAAALTVTPVDDLLVEGDETIVFSATTSATGYSAISDVGLNIVDDDNVITLSFVDAAGQPVDGLGEDDGRQTVRLVASVPAGVQVPANVDVSVSMTDTGETATEGTGGDYTTEVSGSDSLTLSISSGGTSGSSGDMVFTTFSDRVFEDHEVVRGFSGTAPAPYTVEDVDLLILDADRTIVVTMDNQGSNRNHQFFSDEDGGLVLRETGDPHGPVGGEQFCHCHNGPRPWFTVRVDGVTSSTYSENLSLHFNGFAGTAEIHAVAPDLPGTPDVTSTGIRPFFQATYGLNNYWPTLNAGSIFFRFLPINNQNTIDSYYDYIAEPDETFKIGFDPVDGFEIVNVDGLIIDDDVQVYMAVQSNPTLAEGSSGTDLVIGAGMNAFHTKFASVPSGRNPESWTDADRSVLTSDTVVALSVAEGPGLLSAGDFSFDWARRSIPIPAGKPVDDGWLTTLENISVVDDDVVEGLERLRIVGRPALAATKPDGSPTDQVVTFNDAVLQVNVEDADADVSLSVSPGSVVEKTGGQTVTVLAEFAGSSSVLTSDTNVVVQLGAGGGATLRTDFTTGETSDRLTVTIPAGETRGSKSFTLTAPDDGTDESAMQETVTFEGHGTLSVGGQTVTVSGASLDILDPGKGVVLSLTDTADPPAALSAVGEDGGAQTVRITATADAAVADNPAEVTVTVGAAGSSADAGVDYTLSGSSVSGSSVTVSIAVGETVGTADVTVAPVSDTVTEDNETIRFTGEATGFAVAPVSLAVTDADRAVKLGIAGVDAPFAVELDDPPADYTGGRTRCAASVQTRYIRLEGALGSGAGDGFVASTSSTYSANVGFRVVARPGTATKDLDYVTTLEHMSPSNHKNLSVGAGAVSGHVWIPWTNCQDDYAEPTKEFYFQALGNPSGFVVERMAFTVLDDDIRPRFSGSFVEGGSGSVEVQAEFQGSGTDLTDSFAASLTGAAAGDGSGAAGADDFSWPSPSAVSLTIAGGSTASPAAAVSGLSIVDDAVVEGPEELELVGTYTQWGETREAGGVLTIEDNDANVVLSVSPGTVVEGSGAQPVRVTARFAGTATELTSDTTVTVTIASGDGTEAATLGTDFTTDAAGDEVSVVIPAGSLFGSATVDVTAPTDADTGVETANLTGAGMMGPQTLSVTPAVLNIAGSGITLTVDDADTGTSGTQTSLGEEDTGTKTVQVSAALPSGVTAPSGGVVVGLNAVGGTAVRDDGASFEVGEDFRVSYPPGQSPAPPPGHGLAVAIPANGSTGTATFTVVLNDDDVAEGSTAETVVIEGAAVDVGGTSYEVVSTSFGITDDDASPTTIALTVLDTNGEDLTEVWEPPPPDRSTVRVRVKAALPEGSKVLPRSVTVPLVLGVAGQEPAAWYDYTPVTGPLSGRGRATLAVVIPVHEDEGTVDFDLELRPDGPRQGLEGPEVLMIHGGATLGAALTGLGFTTVESDSLTFLDSDILLGLLDADGDPLTSVLEGASPEVRVQLSYRGSHVYRSSNTPRIGRVTFGGGTAAGSDYRIASAPGAVFLPVFQNSASKTFGLTAVNDRAFEGDETLRVSAAVEGFAVAPVDLVIRDNDVRLSLNQASVREDAGRITRRVTATVGSAPSVDLVVNVRVAGSGYTSLSPRSFSITIPAGETSGSRTFSMTVTDDSLPGNSKTVSITGSASGFDISSARLTITDDGDVAAPPPPSGGGGGGGGGGAPPPSGGGGGGGGGGAPPPAGGGGGGGGAPPPAQPPAPACVGRFCDDDGNVHQDNIERIAAWRITLGCDAQDAAKYCPDAEITRRQMSAFLHRAVSQRWTIQAPEGIQLADVEADEWFRPFAEWVVSVGAFSAPGGVFNPGGVVTRADMAIMMIGAFPHLDAVPTETSRFGDAEGLSPEVLAALEGMYQTGVTRGCSAEPLNYCPNQPVTRAQMASFFVRAVNLAPADTQPTAGG